MWKLFFKGKIGIIKKPSQKFVSPLYISIDIKVNERRGVHANNLSV